MKPRLRDLIGFYSVGLLMFIIPQTRGYFEIITPLSLLMVLILVLKDHKNWNFKTVIWFSFIFSASIIIEYVGVKTGMIFGNYQYGSGLGPKIAGTPLIIGVNWLFLLYSTNNIAGKLRSNRFQKIIIAALLMVFYDLVIEFAAPFMDLWQFDGLYPPFKNFIAWFVISIVFLSGFDLLKIKTGNKISRWFYFVQICFLGIIAIFSNIFIK